MKKSDLLQRLDADLPEKPAGFCYVITRDSHKAEDPCSDILFRLFRDARGDGNIAHGHTFIW